MRVLTLSHPALKDGVWDDSLMRAYGGRVILLTSLSLGLVTGCAAATPASQAPPTTITATTTATKTITQTVTRAPTSSPKPTASAPTGLAIGGDGVTATATGAGDAK